MAEKTRWEAGDPEPSDPTIKLRGRSGTAWYNYAGGWRNGDMSAYHTISWEQVLQTDAPLREYRYVKGRPTLVDDIPAAMFGETFTMRSPDGTVISLVRAEAAQQVIDRTEKELAERTAELDEIQKVIGRIAPADDLGDVAALEDLDERFVRALTLMDQMQFVVEAAQAWYANGVDPDGQFTAALWRAIETYEQETQRYEGVA